MKRYLPLFLLLAATLAFLVWLKERPVPEALGAESTVLAFGDSLTYGTGAELSQSYPAVLERLSRRRVVNAGIPGETSAEGLQRLPGELERHRPALLILCHGGNDILRGLSKEALKANLSQMVRMAKARGIKILIVGVPDIATFGFSALDLYKEVADAEGTMYESGVIGSIERNPGLKSDRVHPNAEGYAMMAERFDEVLKDEGVL